jgi:hypothetical protein
MRLSKLWSHIRCFLGLHRWEYRHNPDSKTSYKSVKVCVECGRIGFIYPGKKHPIVIYYSKKVLDMHRKDYWIFGKDGER